MKKNKKGQKLKKDFVSGPDEISKYKRIEKEVLVPGRPGEEYYEITTNDGKKTQISVDQKRELDKKKSEIKAFNAIHYLIP